mgnify:CR=1 FL=1
MAVETAIHDNDQRALCCGWSGMLQRRASSGITMQADACRGWPPVALTRDRCASTLCVATSRRGHDGEGESCLYNDAPPPSPPGCHPRACPQLSSSRLSPAVILALVARTHHATKSSDHFFAQRAPLAHDASPSNAEKWVLATSARMTPVGVSRAGTRPDRLIGHRS